MVLYSPQRRCQTDIHCLCVHNDIQVCVTSCLGYVLSNRVLGDLDEMLRSPTLCINLYCNCIYIVPVAVQ